LPLGAINAAGFGAGLALKALYTYTPAGTRYAKYWMGVGADGISAWIWL
jgi:hypothetical protein